MTTCSQTISPFSLLICHSPPFSRTCLWRPINVAETLVYRAWYCVDGAPSESVSALAEQDLTTAVAEDIRLVNSVQQGLDNLGYRPGPLIIDPAYGVNSEHSIRTIHEWVLAAHNEMR